MMISRRSFLQGLGVGALAVAAPVVGRRIWQVHRNAPVKRARIYNVDEARVWIDGKEIDLSSRHVPMETRYRFRTTLDERTRPEHMRLDGKYLSVAELNAMGIHEPTDDEIVKAVCVNFTPPGRVEWIETEIGFSL